MITFSDNTLLVGGNNMGKSTICEALDLVLGPERLYRRPVVDEHDFYRGKYIDNEGKPVLISIKAVLIDLSDEAKTRFASYLRLWDDINHEFIDEVANGLERADDEGVLWALAILFEARYDSEEDDFVGDTFFDHPAVAEEDLDDEKREALGQGRIVFTQSHKRLCGYVYLRALRTGSRALGLQRGSLLDTILRLSSNGVPEMWFDTLKKLHDLEPAIGDIEQLEEVRTEIRKRMTRFVDLAPGKDSTSFFASDLTREHLREVVRLFIGTSPSNHSVPFRRQGTGSINLLVFALLTLIADRKGSNSVIFAMEEPEIALPPHTQRRVTRFVRTNMGQTIITSHSPYVIENFEPEDIVMLNRKNGDHLIGTRPDLTGLRPHVYRNQRRQFAEAILARAVVVVEGSTESALLLAASSILEQDLNDYVHFDLAGVSVFTADGDDDVPRWGPTFKALDKQVFGFRDKQTDSPSNETQVHLQSFDGFWESPEVGIEELLISQTSSAVHRRFLNKAVARADYPSKVKVYKDSLDDFEVSKLAKKVLKARKGEGYAYGALFIEECQRADKLPEFLKTVLIEINCILRPLIQESLVPAEEPMGEVDQNIDDGSDEKAQLEEI